MKLKTLLRKLLMESNYYFDEESARVELVNMIEARNINGTYTVILKNGKSKVKTYNTPSTKLVNILKNLHTNILKKPMFAHYPYYLKTELSSKAMLDFLEWGHNYKAGKSAYSYLTQITINSYRRSLSNYYKTVNEHNIINDGIRYLYGSNFEEDETRDEE